MATYLIQESDRILNFRHLFFFENKQSKKEQAQEVEYFFLKEQVLFEKNWFFFAFGKEQRKTLTLTPPNVIELLKRHKASRDAGIISQEEFMDISI